MLLLDIIGLPAIKALCMSDSATLCTSGRRPSAQAGIPSYDLIMT